MAIIPKDPSFLHTVKSVGIAGFHTASNTFTLGVGDNLISLIIDISYNKRM